jgi:hypothetical protein
MQRRYREKNDTAMYKIKNTWPVFSGHKSRLRNARESHHRVSGRVQIRVDGERRHERGGRRCRICAKVVVQQCVGQNGVQQLHGRGLQN